MVYRSLSAKDDKMVVLKKKIKASSLLEVMTASVIMLIVFTVTMDTFTRLLPGGMELADVMKAENVLFRIKNREAEKPGTESYREEEYDWGKVVIERTDYRKGIEKLTLTAFPTHGNRRITYRCPILKKDESVYESPDFVGTVDRDDLVGNFATHPF